jgi:hypothetical protein
LKRAGYQNKADKAGKAGRTNIVRPDQQTAIDTACGSNPAGWYWSGTQNNKWNAWDQRFSDGDQNNNNKDNRSSVRCVR